MRTAEEDWDAKRPGAGSRVSPYATRSEAPTRGDPVDSMAYHAGRVKVAAAEEMKWQALLGKKLKTTPRKVGG